MPEGCLESVPYTSRKLVESQGTSTETAFEMSSHAQSSVFHLAMLRKAALRADLGCRRKARRTLKPSVALVFFSLDLAASFGVMLGRLRTCKIKIQSVPCRTSVVSARYASCSASTDGSKTRNIALMAHIGIRASPSCSTRQFVVPPLLPTAVSLN